MSGNNPLDKLFPDGYASFRDALTASCAFFGLRHPNLTPYCLRRGGATWHFYKYGSYHLTQELGRWQDARTAKGYIDQAGADLAKASMPAASQAKLRKSSAMLAAFAA